VTNVKVCGITRREDAEEAARLGAWALGMIFWPDSPRACTPESAEEIGQALKRRAELAGVFVNATLDEVAELADRCSFSLLQLHGDEGPAYCREAARRTGCKVMKAVRVRDAASVDALRAFPTDFHLLDAHVPGQRGGTGQSFNWDLARRHRGPAQLVLSGGLDPDNVGDAIAAVQPFAVDSASGTEASPGVKDPTRLEAFFRAVEAADSSPVTASAGSQAGRWPAEHRRSIPL
jgi:phosphoribosylanthranilate isomerase